VLPVAGHRRQQPWRSPFAAFGGVYIGGGIAPRFLEEFRASGFRQRFEDKGRYRAFLADIPTWAISRRPAGAARALPRSPKPTPNTAPDGL